MQRGKLQDLIDRQGYPPDVAKAVYDHAHALGNAEKIELGELRLPSVHDATTWHERETGQKVARAQDKDREDRIRALEARIAQLEEGI